MVNMALGERELYRSGRRAYPLVKSLPTVSKCSVSIQQPNRPTSVRLQPQDEPIENWQHENGRLTFEVPGFAVHQIVVFD